MSSPSEWIAAIDIGGSKIAVTLADASGPRYRLIQTTVKTGTSRAIPEQCHALLHSLCHQADIHLSAICGVGVSACGPFAYQDNYLGLVAPNLCGGLSNAEDLPNDWTFIPLASVLQEHCAHVVIDNDCIAALTAERFFGAAQNEPNCAYVTWSTGIGFGLCVDGHVLRGKHGNAGHAGHMLLSEVSDALCGCGNQGDLEGLISGRNLSQRLQQPLEVIFTAAANGDPTSLAIAEDAAKWLGRGHPQEEDQDGSGAGGHGAGAALCQRRPAGRHWQRRRRAHGSDHHLRHVCARTEGESRCVWGWGGGGAGRCRMPRRAATAQPTSAQPTHALSTPPPPPSLSSHALVAAEFMEFARKAEEMRLTAANAKTE